MSEWSDVEVHPKSGGLTPSERELAQLCETTFLRLWSYPNLYRYQGGGKELCDVLVVFGEHIVIFSDKSCAYPDTGDPVVDWARWFSRSVAPSARQVFGAERWLRQHPDRVFLDARCTQPVPLKIASVGSCKVHRVVVARGAGTRCSSFFGGDSGSLLVRSDICGAAHVNPAAGTSGIFRIGQVNPERGFVHVLDDANFHILLSELDTVSDFVTYLDRKESLMGSGKVVYANGEEDLLAYYMTHVDASGEHGFDFPPSVDLISLDHFYRDMPADPQYVARKEANEPSYVWDRLINHVSEHLMEGTLMPGSSPEFAQHERGLRALAAENRLARRHLGNALKTLVERPDMSRPFARVVLKSSADGRGYCFLVWSPGADQSFETFRRGRASLLGDYCKVAKLKYPSLREVVGVATEPNSFRGRSVDLLYLDAEEWTEEAEAEARALHERGILQSPTVTRFHEEEWPHTSDATGAQ